MKTFLILILVGTLSACDRAQKNEMTSLSLSLPKVGAAATTGLSDMNCFGVFVSGPEKDLQKYRCEYTPVTSLSAAGFNFGTFVGGFYRDAALAGTQFKIEVPNGSDRVLRLMGVKVDTSSAQALGISNQAACEGKFAYRKYYDPLYIISESTALQLKGEDLAVSMTTSFDASKEISSCSGLGLEDLVGIPAKLAVIVQDESAVLTTYKNVSSSNCVGVKFQIQDATGKPATVTSAFDAEIVETVESYSIGNFYYPIASSTIDICSAVNLVPAANGKIPLAFYSGLNYFNEIVLYYRPNAASSVSTVRKIEVTSPSASLKGGSRLVNYVMGTRTPTKYAFYDLFSNVSSVNSTPTNTASLLRNECRLGAVQFLDQYSTPYERSTFSNPPDDIRVSALPVGSVEFFATQANCSAAVAASADHTISMPMSTAATGYGFFYKVTASAPTTISFKVWNVGTTAYPVITSGDLSPAVNLWQISN